MADSQVIFKYNGHEGQQRILDLGSCCVCMWAHAFLYVCLYTCMCEGQRTTLSVFSQMLSTSLNFFCLYVYLFILHWEIGIVLWCGSEGQRTACRSPFSPSPRWILRLELTLSVFVASALTRHAISLTWLFSKTGYFTGGNLPMRLGKLAGWPAPGICLSLPSHMPHAIDPTFFKLWILGIKASTGWVLSPRSCLGSCFVWRWKCCPSCCEQSL